MQRLLPRFLSIPRQYALTMMSKSVAASEGRKCLELNASDIICKYRHRGQILIYIMFYIILLILAASMAQSQPASVVDESMRAESIPLLDQTPDISPAGYEVTTMKIDTGVISDRTPLPFEDIPGPAVLKIWEKYWKYVPLLGTQLFSSLLINRFTQGRLSWNRNVTPLKYLFNEYGCIVRINGPLSGDIVMIHRPEHIAEVFKQEGDAPVRSGIDILQHYRLNYRKYRLAGPFSLQGLEWLEMREKVEKDFEQIASYSFCKIEAICDELIGRIYKIRNRQNEVPGNFHEDLLRWAMECFCNLTFNKHLGFLESAGYNSTSEASRIINALAMAHKYMSRCETGFQVWRFFLTPFAKKLFDACDVLDGVIAKYVRQAQSKLRTRAGDKSAEVENSSPILEKFLLNEGIHPDDICTLLMDMIILGVQAAANSEAFLLYYLARNPRTQRRLYDEISTVLPNTDSPFTENALKNMPYLKACLQETLRLRPTLPYISRLLPKTISLHGYTIPKGTFVIMANQITSQREENFEDPTKFRPERWLVSGAKEDVEFSYLPFGYGARSCLGKRMAETEMMLLTAKLIRQFRIEYDYADIGSKFMMVNVPDKSLRFRFVERN
ncbi:probable cytochrome P450 12a5, mitochondrial [Ceratina calcarata]|uniref:Probable cytochrome P450 12a5, mitochondrial n=1 Tax=Ceratina calcarata TaxID=156304 RepID=A0AAJ7JDM6_9HYME|nr:probable cytochrome P450 12a5, mitochondrial [Ceratina calcarata]